MMESSHILIVVVKSIGAFLGGAQLYLAALPEVKSAHCIGAFQSVQDYLLSVMSY